MRDALKQLREVSRDYNRLFGEPPLQQLAEAPETQALYKAHIPQPMDLDTLTKRVKVPKQPKGLFSWHDWQVWL